MISRLLKACLLLLCLGAQSALTQTLALTPDQSQLAVASYFVWLSDSNGMQPEDAFRRLLAGQGQQTRNSYPNFGYISDSRWLLLAIDNRSARNDWLLDAGAPLLDHLDVYLFNGQQQLEHYWPGGSIFAIDVRPFPHHHLVFPLTLPAGKSWLLLHASGDDVVSVPAHLYTPSAFYQQDSRNDALYGAFFGAISILCLYNLLLFFSTRDRSYFYYVLYLGGFGLFILAREGLALRWIWPQYPGWNSVCLPLIGLAATAFSFLFARDFLQLPRLLPSAARYLTTAFWLLLLFLAGSALYLRWTPIILSLLVLVWPLIGMLLAWATLRKGYAPASYFMLSFACVASAVALYSLMTLNLIANSWLIQNSLQFSLVAEALLLSFALAHRMTLVKRENEQIQQQTQQELELKVRERTQELHTALNARSQFLAVMSHEIRTPLNGILGTLDLLKTSSLDSQQEQQLSVIETSGNSLLQLINDILDYSRLDAGKMPLNEDTFSLASLVQECCTLFEPKAALNGNRLALKLDPNVGSLAYGDALRVRQLLTNLISNAVKFTHNGSIEVCIHREPGNSSYVYFAVTDTGIGIAADKLSLLFELFQQADNSTSRQYGGTGLGLAVCQQLVEIMGGEIGVFSEIGQGSTFWFHLPLPEAVAVAPSLVDTTEITPASSARSSRLLIVDDNDINLMVAAGLCKKLGHEVETCSSGSEAIATLLNDQRPFDAVLMDCEMPIMDGFTTTREIIRLQKEGRICNIPIAALTAHAVPDKIRACHEVGMVLHIAKPVNLEKLRTSLEGLLN